MIEIKFSGATPHEVQQQILDFATPYIEKAVITAAEPEAPKKPRKQPKTVDAPQPEPEQTAAEPEEAGTWEPGGGEAVEHPAEEHPAEEPAVTYTFVDVRAKGIEAAGKYGQPAVKEILTELGAKGMSALKEDQFAAFIEKLEGLGDSNA